MEDLERDLLRYHQEQKDLDKVFTPQFDSITSARKSSYSRMAVAASILVVIIGGWYLASINQQSPEVITESVQVLTTDKLNETSEYIWNWEASTDVLLELNEF